MTAIKLQLHLGLNVHTQLDHTRFQMLTLLRRNKQLMYWKKTTPSESPSVIEICTIMFYCLIYTKPVLS